MRRVARRYLDRRAVPIAVGLLALGDHLHLLLCRDQAVFL